MKMIISSSAPETIANNYDLLTQILLCLPIKSLLRFKGVSKQWQSLISSPHFYRRLNLSGSSCALLVEKRSHSYIYEYDFFKLDSTHSDAPFKTLTFVSDPSDIKIIQSCNGFLFCCSIQMNKYYIYNPTTKQYTTITPPTVEDEYLSLCLAFDPSISPHYKVICARQHEISEPDYQIEIYSSETGLWRVSAANFTLDHMDIGFYGGVFWNGAIHWYTDSGTSFCFDVDQEKIREMPMPPISDDWYRRRFIYFGESRGHLNLIEIYRHAATQFNVCELEKDYSGWFVKYRVELEGVITTFPEIIKTQFEPTVLNYYAYQIWSIVRGENDEDTYMVLHIPAKIILYNLKDKSFKKLFDFTTGSGATYKNEDAMNFGWYNAYEYIKSLACV